jgi:hypothetical protein
MLTSRTVDEGEKTKVGKRGGNRIHAKRFVGFSVSLSPEMLEEIDAYCDRHHISRALAIRWSVRNWLNTVNNNDSGGKGHD